MDTCHHKNLRAELIDTGMELLRTHDVDDVSLREAARLCHVSNAAPKNHFATRGAYVTALAERAAEMLDARLARVWRAGAGDDAVIFDVGRAYVGFFVENPSYHGLFSAAARRSSARGSQSYPNARAAQAARCPFASLSIFGAYAERYLRAHDADAEGVRDAVLAMWSVVDGVAAIAASGLQPDAGGLPDLAARVLAENIVYSTNEEI